MSVEYPREALLADDADAIIASARTQVEEFVDGADDVLLVPKSFGTRVVGALTDTVGPVETVSAIFVTPMFQREPVRDAIVAAGWRSMLAVGSADDVCHGLEIPGDLAATTAGFDQLGRAAPAFIGAAGSTT